MYDVFVYLDRYVALKRIFFCSDLSRRSVYYYTSACTFSTMHMHLCFTLLVTLAFHSHWSRVFHPCKMVPRFPFPRFPPLHFWWSRVFQSRVFIRPVSSVCVLLRRAVCRVHCGRCCCCCCCCCPACPLTTAESRSSSDRLVFSQAYVSTRSNCNVAF